MLSISLARVRGLSEQQRFKNVPLVAGSNPESERNSFTSQSNFEFLPEISCAPGFEIDENPLLWCAQSEHQLLSHEMPAFFEAK